MSENGDRFVIAYCHPGQIHTDFHGSLLNMLRVDAVDSGRHLYFGEIGVRGLYIAQSRNEAVDLFLQQDKADWLIFADTDIIFEPKQAYQLIDAAHEANAKIMAATYFGYLSGTLWPVLFKKYDGGVYDKVREFSDDKVQEIDACGMGFTLIHREVFEALKNPEDSWPWFGHDLYMGKRMGEDICFCERASQKGIRMYADGRNIVRHIKSRAESMETWLASLGDKAAIMRGEVPETVIRTEPHANGATA